MGTRGDSRTVLSLIDASTLIRSAHFARLAFDVPIKPLFVAGTLKPLGGTDLMGN